MILLSDIYNINVILLDIENFGYIEDYLDKYKYQANLIIEYIEFWSLHDQYVYEDVKITLNVDTFKKFKTISTSNSNCTICLEDMTCGIKLDCNHIFHKDCIYKWLCCENVKCPLCRQDVRDFFTL